MPSLRASTSPASVRQQSRLTVERAIQDYLQYEQTNHRRPKTVQWHQKALGLFQHYLLSQCQCVLISQVTEAQVQGWLAFLRQMPTVTGHARSVNTVESYARSARAFCQWLVRQNCLESTPFANLILLKGASPLLHLLEPGEWERLLLACRPAGETGVQAERATARNQAILWVLAETGMCVSEVCGLRLSDLDREQGRLRVRGKGSKSRQLPLGQDGLRFLLLYLDQYRPDAKECLERTGASQDHLFLSEECRPLTDNGVTLLFRRLIFPRFERVVECGRQF